MSQPLLGSYMVTRTGGLMGRLIRAITHSPVNHAAIYIGADRIVEAQCMWPIWRKAGNEARVSPVDSYPNAIWSTMALTSAQRGLIVYQASLVVGTPYNFLDIAAQAIVRLFKWHAPEWAIQRISRGDRLQCAQLVDQCYRKAGVNLFHDSRPTGLVAPSDLYDLIMEDR